MLTTERVINRTGWAMNWARKALDEAGRALDEDGKALDMVEGPQRCQRRLRKGKTLYHLLI